MGKPFYCQRAHPLCFGGAREDGSTATTGGQGARVHDHFFGQSGTHTLANERNVVKIRKDAPLEILGPLGCGIQTGAEAVINALKVRPGTSFASFGAGAAGLAAVTAARIAGPTTIIAADMVPLRLDRIRLAEASFDINSVMLPGKKIWGIIEEESVPDIFIPQLVELHMQGLLSFEKLVKFYQYR